MSLFARKVLSTGLPKKTHSSASLRLATLSLPLVMLLHLSSAQADSMVIRPQILNGTDINNSPEEQQRFMFEFNGRGGNLNYTLHLLPESDDVPEAISIRMNATRVTIFAEIREKESLAYSYRFEIDHRFPLIVSSANDSFTPATKLRILNGRQIGDQNVIVLTFELLLSSLDFQSGDDFLLEYNDGLSPITTMLIPPAAALQPITTECLENIRMLFSLRNETQPLYQLLVWHQGMLAGRFLFRPDNNTGLTGYDSEIGQHQNLLPGEQSQVLEFARFEPYSDDNQTYEVVLENITINTFQFAVVSTHPEANLTRFLARFNENSPEEALGVDKSSRYVVELIPRNGCPVEANKTTDSRVAVILGVAIPVALATAGLLAGGVVTVLVCQKYHCLRTVAHYFDSKKEAVAKATGTIVSVSTSTNEAAIEKADSERGEESGDQSNKGWLSGIWWFIGR